MKRLLQSIRKKGEEPKAQIPADSASLDIPSKPTETKMVRIAVIYYSTVSVPLHASCVLLILGIIPRRSFFNCLNAHRPV